MAKYMLKIEKKVDAELMTKKEYCERRGWDVPSDEDPNELFFMYTDEKGSVTCMREDLFLNCATLIS